MTLAKSGIDAICGGHHYHVQPRQSSLILCGSLQLVEVEEEGRGRRRKNKS